MYSFCLIWKLLLLEFKISLKIGKLLKEIINKFFNKFSNINFKLNTFRIIF